MSHGLRVYNSSGQITLDLTDRLSRFIGVFSYASIPPGGTVTLSVPGFTNDGTWFYSNTNYGDIYLAFSVSAGSISITNHSPYQGSAAGSVIVFRG